MMLRDENGQFQSSDQSKEMIPPKSGGVPKMTQQKYHVHSCHLTMVYGSPSLWSLHAEENAAPMHQPRTLQRRMISLSVVVVVCLCLSRPSLFPPLLTSTSAFRSRYVPPATSLRIFHVLNRPEGINYSSCRADPRNRFHHSITKKAGRQCRR